MYKNVLLVILITQQILGCPGNDEYCLACNNDTCSDCAMSYKNGKVCTVPATKIENCVDYKDANLCDGCDLGYKLSTDKKSCVKIDIDNCLAVNPEKPTHCFLCADSKRSDPSTGKCTDTDCTQNNC